MTDAPTSPTENSSSGRGSRFWILAIVIGLAIIVAGVLIYQASMAAFTAQTETAANSFSAGELDIANDSEATAGFNLTDLQPGDTGTDDILVSYSGSLDSDVRLFAKNSEVAQTLADNIQLTITTEGGAGSPWTGTLAEFQALTDFSMGILALEMTEGGDAQSYTVAYEVLDGAEMGATADVTFVWEAQGISENN
jgi:predicted ribosomally synthesized peptide with SipW-like signal peptide